MSQEVIEIILRGRDEASPAFDAVRAKVLQHQQATRTLNLYMRQQQETTELGLRAFAQVGNVVGRAQVMYMQYNVAQIRLQNIQERLSEAQRQYSEALQKSGAGSDQATNASRRLADAQRDLQQAQLQNNMMMAGFIFQIPTMVHGLLQAAETMQRFTQMTHAATAAQAMLQAVTRYGPIAGLAIGAVAAGGYFGYMVAQQKQMIQKLPSAQTLAGEAVLVRRSGTAVVHEGERISRERGIGGGVSVHVGQIVMRPDGLSPGMAARELGWRLRHLRPEEF